MAKPPVGGFLQFAEGFEGKTNLEQVFPNALRMHSGRAAWRFIIQEELNRIKRIQIPELCCPVLIKVIEELGLPYEVYELDKNLLPRIEQLKAQSLVLMIPYYFINDKLNGEFYKEGNLRKLACSQGFEIVVDNTQNFFAKPYTHTYSFNSVRKWIGTPDGSLLYSPYKSTDWFELPLPPKHDVSFRHLIGESSKSDKYPQFLENEAKISSEPHKMAFFTESILTQSDLQKIADRRKQNFLYLHGQLRRYNQLCSTGNFMGGTIELTTAPFCYPFIPYEPVLKETLAEVVYLPHLWEGSPLKSSDTKCIAEGLLALPLDHTISFEDLDRVAGVFTC